MSPEWNEDVVFEISNEDTLNITIFDKESVDKDRYMAQASVSILDWIEHGTFEGSLNLVDKKNKSEGTLLLSATFKASDNTGSWI
jgi:Ca2+-dependent lipid-binding protein